MIKKIASLALVGMLAMPAVTLAESVEDRLAALEEKSETWDTSSRITWSGDFRFRADMLTGAEAPSHYTALDVARGVNDVLTAGLKFPGIQTYFTTNFPGSYGDADPLSNLANALAPLTTAQVVAQFQAGGATAAEANDLAVIFKDPDVSVLLGQYIAMGATIGQVTGAFSNAENLVAFMKNVPASSRKAIFSALTGAYQPETATEYENDTIYTNRLRLNLRAKAMENLEFKARLAMYKVWGMQNNPVDYTYNNGLGGGQFGTSAFDFDGSSTRQPKDNVLRVDRAFMNWNNIGDMPIWFSIGRRPVTDGPPAHLRMGLNKKMATPVNYMDYPFDGLSLGYAYESFLGIEDFPGRARLCYGRGFESGPTSDGQVGGSNDVDFGGLSWDVFKKGDRFFNFQSFGAFNIFNVPDNVDFVNPLEYTLWENASAATKGDFFDPLDPSKDLKLNRRNLGNIYHTSAVYMSKWQDLNYFVTAGWSRTDAKGMDEIGTSLLSDWWSEPEDHDGYSFYLGVRYDMDDAGLKFGLEYNWGSEYWIAFTPGHDDVYASKLATRGSVIELYTVWDIPAGEKISKYSNAFFRLGYQHYDYEYTGSGFWLGTPHKVDELANDPLAAQFFSPVDTMDQIYLTMEAWF